MKPFAFIDYVNEDFYQWKMKSLTEAWEKIHRKLNESKSDYAYAGNISKAPVLWDEDDWKFLSQFPPKFWSEALVWRYNHGLNEASKTRDEHPHNQLQATDYGTVVLKDGQGKAVFEKVYTGLKTLFEKLEKPIKAHSAHNPPGTTHGDPGISDIDPFETDPTHPKHRSNYKYGVHNFDITAPVEMTDEYIDSIPDEDIKLPKDKERTPANIAKARNDLKKTRRRDFAGFTPITAKTKATTYLNTWLKAQAMGLLGDVSHTKEDPHTQKQLAVTGDVALKDISNFDDNVKVPVVSRKITYKSYNKNGKEKEITDDYRIPVLNPGKLLPRVTDLSSEQREQIAKRRGFDVTKECQNVRDLDWKAIEDQCPAAKAAGQVGDVANLLRNYDILTPEQKTHLKMNQRDLHHLEANRIGAIDDKWSSPKEHYAIGYTPNKAKYAIEPSDMSKEDMKVVLDKYLPEMIRTAEKGISQYIASVGGEDTSLNKDGTIRKENTREKAQKLPPERIKMLEMISGDLAKVAGALLALNLQNQQYGLRDESVKLTNVQDTYNPEENEQNRKIWAWQFARTFNQAAFGGLPGRRQDQKQKIGAVSLDAAHGSGDTQTNIGSNITAGNQTWGQQGSDNWNSNRTNLDPITQGETDPLTGKTVYSIARLGWNVPKMNHAIDEFFNTKRNQILAKGGSGVATFADKAKERTKIVMDSMRELYDKSAQKYMSDGLPQNEIEKKSQEYVQANLKQALLDKNADLFKDIEDDQVTNILKQNHDQLTGQVLTPELKAKQEKYYNLLFSNLIDHGFGYTPELQYDDEEKTYNIGTGQKVKLTSFANFDARRVVKFFKDFGGEEMAKKYSVGFLRAIKKMDQQPMSFEDAVREIELAGIEPIEKAIHKPTMPVAQPAPVQPAIAATNITGLAGDLVTNYKKFVDDPELLRQNLPQVKKSMYILHDKIVSGTINAQEATAYFYLDKAIKKLKSTAHP